MSRRAIRSRTAGTGLLAAGLRAALVVAAALALAGCGSSAAPSGPGPLFGWSAEPLQNDSALSDRALKERSCRSGMAEDFRIDAVLQDQRTTSVAAFLVAGDGFAGDCVVSLDGNAFGSGRQTTVPPRSTAIVVDEKNAAGFGTSTVTVLGGRISPTVASVRVRLSDGRTLEASTGSGHWLAWWPSDAGVVGLDALDAAGSVLATLTDSTPYWQQK